MNYIRIKELSVYHPENKVGNDVYIEHFKERGRDITHFLEVMGKKERYIVDNEYENGLTMAIEASKRVLEKANMTGKDIDYIVFSSQVPEYTFPSNAMFIHDAIEASSSAIGIDTNANCAGMVVAVEQASRYMLANPHISKSLVVGSDYLSLVSNPEEEITYATYGDASCAVILEKTDEETGFIDAKYEIKTTNVEKIIYPKQGLTKSNKEKAEEDLFVNFIPFDAKYGTEIAVSLMKDVLERNQLSIEDVDAFCFSQFAYSDKLRIQRHFDIPEERMIYIGDKYGYTGTSSPFISLYEGIQEGRIKRGDHVLFWTVGAGHQFIVMLFKY